MAEEQHAFSDIYVSMHEGKVFLHLKTITHSHNRNMRVNCKGNYIQGVSNYVNLFATIRYDYLTDF